MKIGIQELSIGFIPLAIAIGLAFIPATIAAKKGYSKVGFWFFGFFLFLIALIVALCISDKTQAYFTNGSSADELSKYKDLYDKGVITREEYEAKKKKILG